MTPVNKCSALEEARARLAKLEKAWEEYVGDNPRSIRGRIARARADVNRLVLEMSANV